MFRGILRMKRSMAMNILILNVLVLEYLRGFFFFFLIFFFFKKNFLNKFFFFNFFFFGIFKSFFFFFVDIVLFYLLLFFFGILILTWTRDHGKVVDMKSMKHIMRYNEFQTDPLSLRN